MDYLAASVFEHAGTATSLQQALGSAFLQHSALHAAPSLQHLQAMSFTSLVHVQAAPLSQQVQLTSFVPQLHGHIDFIDSQPDMQIARTVPIANTISSFFIFFLLFVI
jgi:hypothetical protein